MAGREPGAPSIADTTRMRLNAQTGATSTSRRYQWQIPLFNAKRKPDGTGYEDISVNQAASNEFPIVAVPHDPYDDIANIKQQYSDGAAAGSNWVVPFDQGDAAYELRKRDAAEKAEFDSWIMQKYDITDPAQNLMLQNIAPELFQRREEVIESQQALVSAYAKTRLRGAKSISDLELEWLIETGRLELPQGPIWDPEKWRLAQTGNTKTANTANVAKDIDWNAGRYRFGLFSPMQWLTTDNAGWQPGANRADIRGNPATPYYSPLVPYPLPKWKNDYGPPQPYPYAGSIMGRGRENPSAAERLADASGTAIAK